MAHHRSLKGILFYPMEVGHTSNRRVRLLINDHGADGYLIWKCLIDAAYGSHGYFFPVTGDDVELISADVCRKPPEMVWTVIESCVKRGLFDQHVYTKANALTNDKMQLNFLRGTYERRRKGSVIYFEEKHFLLPIHDLNAMGDKFLDRVVFVETGITLRRKIDDSAELGLFSAEKQHPSAEKQHPSAEKTQNSEKEREREREREYISTNVETADAAPIALKSDEIENASSLAKKNSGKKKKNSAQKRKTRDPDAEPYWHPLRRVWKDFNLKHLKFNVEPIPKSDYSHMHRIIEKLRERATDQGVPWTEPEAVTRFDKFLTTAYQDNWIKEHFELKVLESQKQTIFKNLENGTGGKVNGTHKQTDQSGRPIVDQHATSSGNWS